jgi:hypothetical protein
MKKGRFAIPASGAAAVKGDDFSGFALHAHQDRPAADGAVLNVFVVSGGGVYLGGKTFPAPRAVDEGFLDHLHSSL